MYLRVLCVALLSLAIGSAQSAPKDPAPASQKPSGVAQSVVLDNDVVRVTRVTCEAGCSEPVHSHATNYLNVFLSNMELEFTREGHTYRTDPVAGEVRFLYKGDAQAMRNPTSKRFEWLSITLKKDPRGLRPGVIPANTPFTGMAVRRLLDNDAVRASHLTLDAGMRELPHSHPTDLLVVAITPGEVETVIGGKTERRSMRPGDVMWFPRQVEHRAANVGATSLESVGIHIK